MVKSRLRKTTHKYGIEIPTSVTHTEQMDAKNGNTFWRDAIDLEMHNNSIAFQVLDNGHRAPPGWVKVTGHLVFSSENGFHKKSQMGFRWTYNSRPN